MRKVSVFIATSVDGYIAREDGGLDWLDAANQSVPPGEDCGFHAFMNDIDALVMGRKSFEKVLTFGLWPYEKPVVVWSREQREVPAHLVGKVSFSSQSPKALCEHLEAQGMRNLYIDGGYTIQQFLNEGLITHITRTMIPVLLGTGIPLFGPLARDIKLEHVSTKSYDFGFVQTTYRVPPQD